MRYGWPSLGVPRGAVARRWWTVTDSKVDGSCNMDVPSSPGNAFSAGVGKLAHLMYYQCLRRHENKDMSMTFGAAADLHEIGKSSGGQVKRSWSARNGPIFHAFQSTTKRVQRMGGYIEAYDRILQVAGVVLSYHGGRQLDFARSGIEVLVGIVEKFKEKGASFSRMINSNPLLMAVVKRGMDVLKAVALGTT
ncbi:hypothetical protein BC826DRAFT_968460 [Russula brevipes]|nr:hypothetical protein BC826DRAFT_968460 [Russula brevipes]